MPLPLEIIDCFKYCMQFHRLQRRSFILVTVNFKKIKQVNINSLNIPTLNSFDIYCLRNTFLLTQSSSSRPAQNIVLHSFMHAFYIFFGSKNQLHSTLNNFFDCSRQLVKSFCLNYTFFCSVHQMQYLCRAVGRSEKSGGGVVIWWA